MRYYWHSVWDFSPIIRLMVPSLGFDLILIWFSLFRNPQIFHSTSAIMLIPKWHTQFPLWNCMLHVWLIEICVLQPLRLAISLSVCRVHAKDFLIAVLCRQLYSSLVLFVLQCDRKWKGAWIFTWNTLLFEFCLVHFY